MLDSLNDNKSYIIEEEYTDNDFQKAREILDYEFIESYKVFMCKVGAGYFALGNEPKLPDNSSFENFYPLKTVINLTLQNEANQIPTEYIPFGADGSGNLFCFQRDTNHICFLNHSFDSIDRIAEDFDSFIRLINQ